VGSTEKDCQQAAEWAEHDMTVKPASATALRGEAAATSGRDLLDSSSRTWRTPVDRPEGATSSGEVRQVRLPAAVNDQLAALAHTEHCSPSGIIRAALAEYIAAHTAG